MEPKKIAFFILIILVGLSGCNLEKEIEIEIPDFDNGYVIESYIEPNQEFGLLITKSYGFFEVFDASQLDPEKLPEILVSGVNGYIEVNGNRHMLENQVRIVPGTTTIYNYEIDSIGPLKKKDRIILNVSFPDGEQATAETFIPDWRPVDSVRLEINDKSEAREVSFLSTDSTRTEYFRRQLFRIREGEAEVIQDYIIDNQTAKGGRLAFGSGFEFNVGDTLISRVSHLTPEYYDFYNSVTGSINANSNPFGQPGKISSNIRGSDKVIGIFTGINQSQIVRKIEK